MTRERVSARRAIKKPPTVAESEAMQFTAYTETYDACQTLRDIMAFAKVSQNRPLVAENYTTLSEQTIAAANSGQHRQVVASYYIVMRPIWRTLRTSAGMPGAIDDPLGFNIHELFIVHSVATTCITAFERAIYESCVAAVAT